uniref:F-box domain-containing protein n=1 Tax=Globodera rostochiensis TaxID=31243 RepID=A0A914HT38_GLORO
MPDNVLELIFTYLTLYEDYNSIKLVSRRWHRLATATNRRMHKFFKKCVNFSWHFVEGDHLLSERCSHAACYHPSDCVMYIFGGCTNTYTAFNDLWLFDLSRREWARVMVTRPPLPSPKALASMVRYGDNLLLFGGFSKSSMNPIHQTNTFYNELHLFNRTSTCWEEIISENTAPHLAGHSASIVGNFMLVFGGSMGSSYNNNVYVLDLVRRIWNMPSIPGPCPPPRYGHSQILLDTRHLVVIGGCGGPNVMYSDVWMLDFDLHCDAEWRWTQLKVENLEMTPPYTWCHKAEKVGTNAVIVSRPIKSNAFTRRTTNWNGHRRTSSQSTSASGGSGRLASPDSPLDRKAVAAAFCSSSFEQLNQKHKGKRDERGKPILLTSRSLDDQQKNNASSEQMASVSSTGNCKSLQNSPSTSTNLSVSTGTFSNSLNAVTQQKTAVELHRACSIPAIIVGEIPKLIVTASVEPSGVAKQIPAVNKRQQHAKPAKPTFDSLLDKDECHGNTMVSSSLPPSATANYEAVREYYLTLVRGEFHRLCIVEFSENLGDINQRLETFLSERIGYLSKEEKTAIVAEFMRSVIRGEKGIEYNQKSRHSVDSGQLRSRKSVTEGCSSGSVKHKPSHHRSVDDRPPPPSPAMSHSNEHECTNSSSSSAYDTGYKRSLCVYILRLSCALTEHRVRWEQLDVEEDAPDDKLLYSFVVCRGEIVLFGGMQSDESGMESLNVGLERRAMSSDTFILRPRYNEMF